MAKSRKSAVKLDTLAKSLASFVEAHDTFMDTANTNVAKATEQMLSAQAAVAKFTEAEETKPN